MDFILLISSLDKIIPVNLHLNRFNIFLLNFDFIYFISSINLVAYIVNLHNFNVKMDELFHNKPF